MIPVAEPCLGEEEVKYSIRDLRLRDFWSLHKMYDSLSTESRRYFHPGIFGTKSKGVNWFLAQINLLLSLTPLKYLILRIYPRAVFFIVGAFERSRLIGFAYLKVCELSSKGGLITDLGIAIKDNYQSRGIGSKLIRALLNTAKKMKVEKIYLTVHPTNTKALRLYKKYGFKQTGFTTDTYQGNKSDMIKMELNLNKSQ